MTEPVDDLKDGRWFMCHRCERYNVCLHIEDVCPACRWMIDELDEP